ncbi:MAG: FG-GAP-like repeat-containing protein [Tenuifilaceae bacterium]
MKRSALLLFCCYVLIIPTIQAQEIIIGKENICSPDIPIRPGNMFNFQYNQFIYKQPWIHAQGSINKIAYYYNGASSVSYDVKIYMGHTSRRNFVNRQYVSVNELTLVYNGPFTFPGATGWLEITLQTPFNYNNIDNLVIAIDKNSVDPQSQDDCFSSSILSDDAVSIIARDQTYNIDPANPQGIVGFSREIPNIKISGSFTESPYIYVYGTKSRDISTDPNSTLTVDVETNLTDYSISSLPVWLTAIKDLTNKILTFNVVSASGTLSENIRTANVVLSGANVKQDTILINQYKFEPKKLNTAPYYSSAHSFADFDQDKDLDLVGFFHTVGVNNNDHSFTFQSLSNLPNAMGLCFWGDYDNDGDLDFVSMYANYDPANNSLIPDAAKIFRNDGPGVYTDINAGLDAFLTDESGIWSSSTWCDYNNDGKLDLLINGPDNNISASTKLYKNLGNDKFVTSGVKLKNIFRGTSDWGDYNKDGLIDLAIHGKDVNGNSVTIIYRNDGSEVFTDIKAGLLGLNVGNVNWGDFDNDGDLDLLTNGENSTGYHIKIYRNDGNNVFTDIKADLKIVGRGFYKWNDYDNDGDLDIAGFGDLESVETVVRYRNDGAGIFVIDFSMVVPGSSDGGITKISNGDYDKDGDIDILVYRMYRDYTKVYRNNSNIPNNTPSVPSGMRSFRNGTRLYLTWNPSSDSETPSKSISYNVRIGTAPGKYDIVAPLSDITTGFIKIPGMGNCSIDTLFFIDNLPLGTYYWSVQSIDNMYAGSAFSPEQTFSVLPPFSKLNPGIPMLYGASAAWGDYDNDNDLDLFVTGRLTNYDGETTRIYKNNGDTTFTEIILNSQGRYSGSIALGDYDNDNDLDILISGKNTGGQEGANIIWNDGNDNFTELPMTFASSQFSSAIWGDADNDGDLDIAVNAEIYRNDGKGVFTEMIIPGGYADMTNNSFADYDNDKDLDFFVSCQWVKKELYRNTNGIFSKLVSNYAPLSSGSMDWSDYDKDGDMDLLISGLDSLQNNLTLISRNDGNGSFYNIDAEIRGVNSGQAHWGDFDNDGDPDIVVAGWSGSRILIVYVNKGNDQFEELYNHPINPHDGVEQVNYAIWGDYNNDGNLDFVKNGLLFSNNYNTPNIAPSAPVNINASLAGFDAFLSWEDPKNPVGVTYNIRIGTTSGGTQIMSPMSDIQTGYRKIPIMGNAQNNKSWIIKSLSPGVTYYWSVQTIDAAFKGGAWAQEKSFTVRNVYPSFIADTVCLGLNTKFTDLTVSPTEVVTGWKWDFGDGNTSTLQNPIHSYPSSGNFLTKLKVQTASFADSLVKTIVVKPKPIADFIADASCQGTPTPVTNTTNLNSLLPVKWEWNFGDNQKSTLKDPGTHGYINAGDYQVNLKVTTNNGCSDSIQKQVIVGSYPVAVITANDVLTFCSDDSVTLSVNSVANYFYNWKRDDVGITDTNLPDYKVRLSGNYSVEVTNPAGNCKTTSQKVLVTSLTKPAKPLIITENYEAGKLCPGVTSVTLRVDQPVTSYSYQWVRNGTPVNNATASTYTGLLPAGDYTVIASKSICANESFAKSIVYDIAPEKPLILVKGPAVYYMATSINTYKSYRWYYNNQLIAGATKYLYVANKKLGTYKVEVANENQCYTSSDAITIPLAKTSMTDFNIPSEYIIGEDTEVFEYLKIYPNPTPGLFTIEMDNDVMGELNISIITQAGKNILKIKFEKTTRHFSSQIDLSGQPKGLYIINLLIEQFKTSRKIIVE